MGRFKPLMNPPISVWLVIIICVVVKPQSTPTTLQGPFEPVTRRFDPSLRTGSDDLPMDHPRLKRNVSGYFPEQIALALSSSPTSMWVSWVTGDAQIGTNVSALDPASVASEVWYGKESGNYTNKKTGINSYVYSQLYPFVGLLNYTSGIIHHARIDDLDPATKYYYKCGDSSIPAMSGEYVFETLPLPSASSYPSRIALVGDLGLTSNSTTTIDHLVTNDPSLILMVGDLSYANQYLTTGEGSPCYSCSFPDAPIRETYQPRWDGWGRFMEPLISRVPMMVIEGNHEIEPQVSEMTFRSYLTRFAVPSEESGSNSNFYYSFNAGGIHFIMLGAYVDYNATGAQYAWLKKDLDQVDRTKTPWLLAAWHPPWYNSYNSHYQEFECMRQEMESLLYQYYVDIVFTGHVHAYERMNRVYNYTLDRCGPVYITVGDGGNIEKADVDHADDPGKCPTPTDNTPEFGGVCHINFTSGPAKGQFCWNSQPEWSAFRESSFGHGILEVMNSTYALWTWHRNQDIYKNGSRGDQIYIVRQPDLCYSSATSKALSSYLADNGILQHSSCVYTLKQNSLCYPWLRPTTPHKLAPRFASCTFLGYNKLHKRYYYYDLTKGSVASHYDPSTHLVMTLLYPLVICMPSSSGPAASSLPCDFSPATFTLFGPIASSPECDSNLSLSTTVDDDPVAPSSSDSHMHSGSRT